MEPLKETTNQRKTKMNPTKSESIAKLAQWCVDNSSETFSAFFKWSPHISEPCVRVHSDGWEQDNSVSDSFSLYTDSRNDAQIDSWVDETITELNTLLAESNERNSPENEAKLKAERDAKELARAK